MERLEDDLERQENETLSRGSGAGDGKMRGSTPRMSEGEASMRPSMYELADRDIEEASRRLDDRAEEFTVSVNPFLPGEDSDRVNPSLEGGRAPERDRTGQEEAGALQSEAKKAETLEAQIDQQLSRERTNQTSIQEMGEEVVEQAASSIEQREAEVQANEHDTNRLRVGGDAKRREKNREEVKEIIDQKQPSVRANQIMKKNKMIEAQAARSRKIEELDRMLTDRDVSELRKERAREFEEKLEDLYESPQEARRQFEKRQIQDAESFGETLQVMVEDPQQFGELKEGARPGWKDRAAAEVNLETPGEGLRKTPEGTLSRTAAKNGAAMWIERDEVGEDAKAGVYDELMDLKRKQETTPTREQLEREARDVIAEADEETLQQVTIKGKERKLKGDRIEQHKRMLDREDEFTERLRKIYENPIEARRNFTKRAFAGGVSSETESFKETQEQLINSPRQFGRLKDKHLKSVEAVHNSGESGPSSREEVDGKDRFEKGLDAGRVAAVRAIRQQGGDQTSREGTEDMKRSVIAGAYAGKGAYKLGRKLGKKISSSSREGRQETEQEVSMDRDRLEERRKAASSAERLSEEAQKSVEMERNAGGASRENVEGRRDRQESGQEREPQKDPMTERQAAASSAQRFGREAEKSIEIKSGGIGLEGLTKGGREKMGSEVTGQKKGAEIEIINDVKGDAKKQVIGTAQERAGTAASTRGGVAAQAAKKAATKVKSGMDRESERMSR